MKRTLPFFFLGILFCSFGNTACKKNTEANTKGFIKITSELDDWINGFNNSKCTDTKPNLANADFIQLANANSDVHEYYKAIAKLNLNCESNNEQYYKDLAIKILKERGEIRKKNTNLLDHTHLLNLLAEDALYAMYVKFKKEPIFKFVDATPDSSCNKMASFLIDNEPVNVCQGDIFVSKGPSAQSSLFSNMLDYQGNFSHSAIAFINEQKKVDVIEAFFEDGVRLRPLNSYYENPFGPDKLYIYRYFGSPKTNLTVNEHRKITITAVDDMVKLINQKTNNKPYDVTSWEYDLKMDQDNNGKMFCSEVIYYIYNSLDVSDEAKPFPRNTHNTINPYAIKFAKNIMEIDNRPIPAPSDIERNANYNAVAVAYDLAKMQQDRIAVALVDIMFESFNSNSSKLDPVLNYIGALQKVDKKVLLTKIDALIASPLGLSDKILTMLKNTRAQIEQKIPYEIGITQIGFLVLFNEIIAPNAIKMVTEIENAKAKPLGQQEIRDLISNKLLDKLMEQVRTELAAVMPKLN